MDLNTLNSLRVWLFLLCVQNAFCRDIYVVTKETTFLGKYGSVNFRGTTVPYKMYKGIRYAMPPLKDRRFQKPLPLTRPLPSPYKAFEYGDSCLQPTANDEYRIFSAKRQSEDCLYLNIFIPVESPDKSTGYAVMVYIHGGGYTRGSGELGAEYLATHGNVIVVTMNYRLGVLGFLGTGAEDAPGNLGLWDQHVALKWIHNNIAAFGGDTERVTIFGESAGAISVHFQALYPHNRGLFQRVIAQSGSPGLQFLFLYDPAVSFKTYVELTECRLSDETMEEELDCLRYTPAEVYSDIMQKLENEQSLLDARTFPYFDNDFITIDPAKLSEISDDNEALKFYRSLDIINGFNSHEGVGVYDPNYLPFLNNKHTSKPSRKDMNEVAIPTALSIFYEPLQEPAFSAVTAEYTDWSDPDSPELLRDKLIKLIGDLMMAVPCVQYSRLHTETDDVTNHYAYLFSATLSNPIIPLPTWAKGANHGDDLGFIFFFNFLDERRPKHEWEYELSYDMMTYWSNFAKSG